MKKITILFVLFFGVIAFTHAQTQSVTNKNNVVVTPEAGDWVIGLDAVPILDYVGNMLNGSTSNTVSASWATTNQAVYGKYFVNPNLAYRGSIRLMNFSNKQFVLTDTNSAGVVPMYLRDYVKSSGSAVVLSAGIEKRKGKGRVQGYYGAEAVLTLGGTTPNMSYGYELEMDATNVRKGYVNATRTISSKAGADMGIGARAILGVEVFILPKISIGAEFGWGLTYRKSFDGETVTEKWGLADPTATASTRYEVVSNTGGSSYFGVDTDNNVGAIKVLFHF